MDPAGAGHVSAAASKAGPIRPMRSWIRQTFAIAGCAQATPDKYSYREHEMTETTDQVLRFVRAYMEREKGLSPSYREIMAACHIGSTSVVNYHLARLAEQGEIWTVPGITRSIRLPGYEYVKVE